MKEQQVRKHSAAWWGCLNGGLSAHHQSRNEAGSKQVDRIPASKLEQCQVVNARLVQVLSNRCSAKTMCHTHNMSRGI